MAFYQREDIDNLEKIFKINPEIQNQLIYTLKIST